MDLRRIEHERPAPEAARHAPARGRPDRLLALRAAAGNRAFARLVQREPDWLADRLKAGALGATAGKRTIELRYFAGKTKRRALVIGGVHGTERQGVQVARLLEKDLASSPADFCVLLVPVLFPDNAAKGTYGTREGATPTNRNFPAPDKDLAASGGKDAKGRDVLPENRLLMELMERYKPERIVSLHGTWDSALAGVFYDPRKLTADEQSAAKDDAARKAKLTAVDAADKDLSLRAAKLIDAQTAGVKGRAARGLGAGAATKAQKQGRGRHGSVAGNVGTSGDLDTGFWGGDSPSGTSLGGYASGRGISIFTVEPPVNRNIADYAPGGDTAGDKVSQADRQTELQAYADAVRTVLLAQ